MWVRVESNFFGHSKVEGLDDHAITLYFRALCKAGDQLTDGRVAPSLVRGKRQQGLADQLVAAGLWHRAKGLEKACPRCWEAVGGHPGDGWIIHDFLRYNPSKEDVEARRSYDRQRKTRSQGNPDGGPHGFPPDSNRIPQARTVRTDGTTEETAVVNPQGLARLRDMSRAVLKAVPLVSPSEVRAEADRVYRRPLAREELA